MDDFVRQYGDEGLGLVKPLKDIQKERILLDAGSFTLNISHGIGGVYTGSLIRLMGDAGVGKTSLACRIAASGISNGMRVLYIDAEAGLNEDILRDTLEDYEIDPDGENSPLIASASNLKEFKKGKRPVLTLQQVFPMAEKIILDAPKGAIVIFDSLDFIATDQSIEDPFTQMPAIVARQMKAWLRRFSGTIKGTGSLVIVISQNSSTINSQSYDPTSFYGGNALKYASSLDIRLKDVGQELNGKELVGRKVKGVITKSKQGLSWRAFGYTIRYDTGPDRVSEVIEVGKQVGVIKGSTWLEYPMPDNSLKKTQGSENLRSILMADPELRIYLEKLILEQIKGNTIAQEVPDEEKQEYE